jgi:hypothetical protein
MLTDTHQNACSVQHGAQLAQGLQRGQRDHHHSTGAQAIQHSLQQRPPVAATTTQQDPIGIRQLL